MTNFEKLIEYLEANGKNKSWDELAKMFEIQRSESARNAWYRYRLNKGNLPPTMFVKPEEQLRTAEYVGELEAKITSFEENLKTGEAKLEVSSDSEIKTLEDLIEKTKIDLNKYKITRWRQNFWANKYQVRVDLEPIVPTEQEDFRDKFIEFLKTFTPAPITEAPAESDKEGIMLVINKQDAHLNKYDSAGNNNIENRFKEFERSVNVSIAKAMAMNKIDQALYVIGSDGFNSEFTGTTTKGTPQQNLLDHHRSFAMICSHECNVINSLLASSSHVALVFVPGNHDEYIGWHLMMYLDAYYRNETRITVDVSPDYTKYVQFGNTAIMLNHGDAMKPEKLAAEFPMGMREEWSSCKHYYIFTGDKHHTLAKDFNGIQFYQLPALSTAKSMWDKKRGFENTKIEFTAFTFTQDNGMADVYKIPIKV